MSAVRHAIVLLAWLGFAIPFAQAQIAYKGHSQASVAGGAVSFVAAQSGGGNTSNRTVNRPGTDVVGRLMIAQVVVKGTGFTITAPSGWTLVNTSNTAGGSQPFTQAVFWKRMTGSEPASYTWSWDGAIRRNSVVIASYDNVDPNGNPIDAWAVQTTNNNATITIPGVTTLTPNSLIVALAGSSRSSNHSTPAGMTERADQGSGGGTTGVTASLSDELRATPGATGSRTSTIAAGAADNIGHMLALRGSALTIPVPSGTAAGDVMIASIAFRPCSATSGAACTTTITPPAGWTQVNSVTDQTGGGGTGGFGSRLFVYRRVAGASEPASYTWTIGGTPVHAGAAGGIISFSGVDTANPIVAEAGQTTASSTSHAAPSINTGTVTNTMLVSTHSANSSTLWTPPSGMTERVDAASLAVPDDLGIAVEMNHELFAGSGATGTRPASFSAPAPAADTGITHMLALRPALAINHFSISHAGSGVACDDQPITITAHDAAHNPVSAGGLTVTLSTTNGKGTWTGIVAGGGTLSDPVPGDGLATYTFAPGSSSVTLSFRYANLTTTSETFGFNVSGGGFSETSGTATAADDPPFTMAQAGFQFRNVTDGATTIPTQIAGKPSNVGFGAKTIRLRAVRTDTGTGSCVALFANQVRTVELGAECNNPAACAGQQVSINGTPIATSSDNGGSGAAAYTGISLSFNAASEADTVIRYPDAGQISLHARFDLDPGVPGFEMTGSSNPFVVRPFGLRISGVTTSGSPSPSDSVFAVAGQNFNVTLTAVAWKTGDDTNNDGVPDSDAQIATNPATPNFGVESTPAQATLSHTLNAPSGGNAGTLGGATTFTGFVSGAKTQAVNWSEVGFINLFASSTNYLGSGQNVTNSSAGLTGVGRFRPAHFALAASGPSGPVLTNRSDIAACADTATTGTIAAGSNALTVGSAAGFAVNDTIVVVGAGASAADLVTTVTAIAGTSFTLAAPAGTSVTNTPVRKIGYTYLSEPARVVFTLNARNAGGTTTQNYTTASGYAKLSASAPASFNFGAVNGTANLTGRTSATLTGDWIAGAATFTAEVTVSRAASPDGPFNTVRIGIAPADSDGVQLQAAALNLDVNNDAVNDRASLGTTRLRFGRLALRNANGSQLVPLRIPVEAQYWNGTAFVTNTEDHCTPAAASTSSSNFAFGGYTGALANCKTALSNGGALSAGRRMLLLAAPGAPNHGSLTLTFNLGSAALGTTCTTVGGAPVPDTPANLTYLRGNWTGGAYDQNPSARATFGTFAGAEEVIFIRENFK